MNETLGGDIKNGILLQYNIMQKKKKKLCHWRANFHSRTNVCITIVASITFFILLLQHVKSIRNDTSRSERTIWIIRDTTIRSKRQCNDCGFWLTVWCCLITFGLSHRCRHTIWACVILPDKTHSKCLSNNTISRR